MKGSIMTIKMNKKTVGLYALCALISQAAFAAQPLTRAGNYAVNTGVGAVNTSAGIVGDVTEPVLNNRSMNTVDGNMRGSRRYNKRSRAAMEMDNATTEQLVGEPKRCCKVRKECRPTTEMREVCRTVYDVPREVCKTVYDPRTVTELKEFPSKECVEVETCTETTETQSERPCPEKPCAPKCVKPCKVKCAKPCERRVRGCSTGACPLVRD